VLEKGARINLFHAAMFGKLDSVQALLINFSSLGNSSKSIWASLTQHARQGRKDSEKVLVLSYFHQGKMIEHIKKPKE
jgi:hypothetical protein